MSLVMNNDIGNPSSLTGPIVIGGNGQLTTYDEGSPAIRFATDEWDSFQETASGVATRPFVVTFS